MTAYKKSPALNPMVPSPTFYDSTTYHLSTIPHDWYTIVHYKPSRSSKVNDLYLIWKPVCNFLLVIS